MKVTIYGAGYVGLVTGIGLAYLGHEVCCMDVDADKIARLKLGMLPIYEENLSNLLQEVLGDQRIVFTTNPKQAVAHATLQIIAVGTPPLPNGAADLQFVLSVAESIGQLMSDSKVIVHKSTVTVGTAHRVREKVAAIIKARQLHLTFDVVSNPEFLREGQAIQDFLQPDRIIVGADNEEGFSLLRALYQPLIARGIPFIEMSTRSAELTKYAANTFLAVKIDFINEMSRLAEAVGADIEQVRQGIVSDQRISQQFLSPGVGFGGSCFPKDVAALSNLAQELSVPAPLIRSVLASNDQQQRWLMNKIIRYFGDALNGYTFALWGLAFKPNTDDIRCASSRVLMEALWAHGALIRAYDPKAMDNIAQAYIKQLDGSSPKLYLCRSAMEALEGAMALIIVTEWAEFCSPNFNRIVQLLQQPVIFDGRNLYDIAQMEQLGIRYFGIGRGAAVTTDLLIDA